MSLLKLDKVSIAFGGLKALTDISISEIGRAHV